jgi:hypothetical protein
MMEDIDPDAEDVVLADEHCLRYEPQPASCHITSAA